MDPYSCRYEFSNITVDFTTAESFRQGQTAYYLLIYFVQYPAETINAVRAWVQQCEKLIVMTSNDWANRRQSKFKNSVLAEPRRVQVATLVLSYQV